MYDLIEKIRAAIAEWATHQQGRTIELSRVTVEPSGIGSNLHVEVVARRGFSDWTESERNKSLYRYLRAVLGDADIVKVSLVLTLTEREYESYARAAS